MKKKHSRVEDPLADLLELAKTVEMTEEEKEEQRRDWVYGNTKLSNPAITRELVDEVADKMPRPGSRDKGKRES